MDNVTHSMIGASVGELAYQISKKSRAKPLPVGTRGLFQFVSIAANNLPDIDFIYTGITGGKIGYLLHHRGHTHTLIAAFPSVLILLGLAWAFCRIKKLRPDSATWASLVGLAMFGHFLHISMDFFNNYGVHPFWPWNNQWFYGDALFIIEPWMWVLLSTGFYVSTSHRLIKTLSAVVFLLALGLGFLTGFVSPAIIGLLTLSGAAFALLLNRLSPLHRATALTMSWVVVTGCFFVTGTHAKSSLYSLLEDTESEYRIEELATFPMPGNPFCWGALASQTKVDEYRVRKGVFAPFPSIYPAASCPKAFVGGRGTAQLTPPTRNLAEESRVLWSGEYSSTLTELRQIKVNCVFAAFLQFSRVPFWRKLSDRLVFGDLRYDRAEALEFADDTAELSPSACPKNLPPWVPPRMRILSSKRN